jgi:tRNA G46 methylase TrmB
MEVSILVILLLVFIAGLIYISDVAFGKLDFSTSRKAAKNVIKILKNRNVTAGNFYDLGSCRGSFAIKIARAFPNMQVVGVDDSKFRTWIAKNEVYFLQM